MYREESRIHNIRNLRQAVDFAGVHVGTNPNMYPTDIDGIIEYKNKSYIIFEVKHLGIDVPIGQRLALERMAKDFYKAEKEAVVFVCEHTIDDSDQPIMLETCNVREVFWGDEGRWRPPKYRSKVYQAIDALGDPARMNSSRI